MTWRCPACKRDADVQFDYDWAENATVEPLSVLGTVVIEETEHDLEVMRQYTSSLAYRLVRYAEDHVYQWNRRPDAAWHLLHVRDGISWRDAVEFLKQTPETDVTNEVLRVPESDQEAATNMYLAMLAELRKQYQAP